VLFNFAAARFSAFCGCALNVIAAGENACAQRCGLRLKRRMEREAVGRSVQILPTSRS